MQLFAGDLPFVWIGFFVDERRLLHHVAGAEEQDAFAGQSVTPGPAGLGVVMYMVNPTYMSTLFSNSLGKTMFFGSILLAVFGFWWMKKVIEIEV